MNAPLSQSVRITAELRRRLKDEFGLEDGEDAMEDTLEGASDLREQIARIAREALRDEAMSKGLGELIKENLSRKSRLEARAEKLRGIVRWALSESGIAKLPLPDMTLTISPGKAPLILDEDAAIPEQFCRVKYEPSRTAIRQAIEDGEPITFARLGNPQSILSIRTR